MDSELTLSKDQRDAVEAVLAWYNNPRKKQIFTLGGLAGTGKTTVIRELLKHLPGAAVCAFAGKAVNVLRKKGVPASTIHMLIYEWTGRKFERKDFLDCRLIIVDEASMVSSELLGDLRSYDLPIIAVGDHGQLEPVGDDPGLMKNLDFKLERIHRQAKGSPIISIAHNVRLGHDPLECILAVNNPAIASITHLDDIIERNRKFHQILCMYNTQRTKINNAVREMRNYSEVLHEGEKLICLRNDYQFGVFNGQQALVESLSPFKLKLDDGRTLDNPPICMQTLETGKPPDFGDFSDEVHFTYSYAITVHKAQGSEWGKVAVVSAGGKAFDPNRWNYTATTRAAEKLIWS